MWWWFTREIVFEYLHNNTVYFIIIIFYILQSCAVKFIRSAPKPPPQTSASFFDGGGKKARAGPSRLMISDFWLTCFFSQTVFQKKNKIKRKQLCFDIIQLFRPHVKRARARVTRIYIYNIHNTPVIHWSYKNEFYHHPNVLDRAILLRVHLLHSHEQDQNGITSLFRLCGDEMRRSVGEELGNHEKVFGTVRAIEWNEVLHGQIRHRGCHSGYVFLYIVNNLLFVIFPPIAFFFCVCGRICKRETSPSMFKKRKKSFPRAGTVFDPLAKTSET